MKKPDALESARLAVLAMAEIKAATDAFDRGEVNVHDAVEAVAAAVDACREAVVEGQRHRRRKWAI